MENKKVLILIPSLNNSGGVANYYSIMQHKFPFEHQFFIVGNREPSTGTSLRSSNPAFRLISDYTKFIKSLWHENFDLVLINPSLNINGILRDYVFYIIAKLYKKKIIIFFRGWDDECAKTIFYGKLRVLFKPLLKSNGFIVLATSFKSFLTPLVKNSPVFLETTVFDESILLENHEALYKLKQLTDNKIRLLFLSRIEKDKGIHESIDAYKKLRDLSINVELIIAGSGSEVENIKNIIEKLNDKNLRYVGRVSGEVKRGLLLSSSILLFPSRHAEGMPNTVLEAMGCGQAVLSSKVGGLNDFFDGSTMGAELTDNFTEEIIKNVTKLHNDHNLLKTVSLNNYNFAGKYFYSEKVAIRLGNIVNSVINKTAYNEFWIANNKNNLQ